MNQAHGLTPDDGHDEDLIAEGQEETMEGMYNFLGEISEQIQVFNATMQRNASSSQPPVVHDDKLCDTGLAWEREFDLYPDASRDVVISRLYNQVWDRFIGSHPCFVMSNLKRQICRNHPIISLFPNSKI